MHQPGGVHERDSLAAAQAGARKPGQLGIQNREDAVEYRPVARLVRRKQIREFAHVNPARTARQKSGPGAHSIVDRKTAWSGSLSYFPDSSPQSPAQQVLPGNRSEL